MTCFRFLKRTSSSRKAFAVLIAVLSFSNTFSQPTYQFSSYTILDGLPTSTITRLYKDSTGYLWLLSENGITRFDGYSFKVHTHIINDSTSVSSSDARSMCIDSEKNILLRTSNSITRYNPADATFKTLIPYSNYNNLQTFNSGKAGTWTVTDKLLIQVNASTATLTNYPLPANLWSNRTKGMFIAKKDIFLIGNSEIYRFDITLKKFFIIKIQYSDSLLDHFKKVPRFFYLKNENDTWFCAEDGLFNYDESSGTFRLYRSIEIPPQVDNWLVNGIDMKNGYVALFSNYDDVYCIDSETGKLNTITLRDQNPANPQRVRIFALYPGLNGRCWASTSNAGLFNIDPVKQESRQVSSVKNDQLFSLPKNIEFVIEDHDVIWITSPGVGLIKGEKYDPAFFSYSPLDNKDPLHNSWCQNVRTISQIDHDNLIIGTLNGAFIFNKKTKECINFDPGFNGRPNLVTAPVSKIFIDKNQNTWFSRWDQKSVYMLNSKTNKLISLVPDDSAANNSNHANRTMLLDSHGWLWIGSDADFIYRMDIKNADLTRSDTVPVIRIDGNSRKKNNLIFNITFVIAENKRGQILIGSENGFYVYDYDTDTYKRYINQPSNPNSISDDNIRSFCIDKKNRLWIGTKNGGLNYFDEKTEKFRYFKVENGLPDNSIYSILEDEHGFLWLGTNKGLAKFNPENGSCRNFTPKDGIQNFEFNTSAAYKTHDGYMVFGGINGFNIFHPDSVPYSSETFPTVVTEIRVFDKKIPSMNENVVLKYNDNYLSFQFASLNYFRNRENQYAYKMEGLDKDWVYCGDRRYTSYANLAPGDYTFKVKSANYTGIWNETGPHIKIHISAAWWNTLTFRLISGLFLLTIIYLVYLYRLNESHKLQMIRNRIARDLHDEVGSNLSSIAIFSEVAMSKSGQVKDDVKPLLAKISSYTLSSMEAISDIVWVINANNDRFENMNVRMRTLAAETFESLGCEITMHVDEKLNKIKMGMENRKNLYLIYKEALNNIAKYANCRHVTIEIMPMNNRLHLKISDNGIGFNMNEVKKGNGLVNMRKRAEALNGRLSITSSAGAGTSIDLEFLPN